MASALDSHLAEIPDLCRRYGVARLFDRYFGLKESLEALYGRSVDLVTAGSLQNPYFIEAVNKSRRVVYAAEDPQAA